MPRSLLHASTIAVMVVTATLSQAATDAWMRNYDVALEQAKETGRDLLVDFSGLDWCGWCKKLDREVFSQEAFIKEATNNFVLVLLDFPHQPENKAKIPESLQKRNAELSETFSIRGFPTVLLIGADGEPYARTGYQRGGVDAYLKHLDELLADKAARDAIQAKLAHASGLDRASLLDELIAATPADQEANMLAEMKEIMTLDADDTAGLKSKYAFKTRMLEAQAEKKSRDFDKAEATYAAIIKELAPSGEQLQELYYQWGEIKFFTKDMPGVVDRLTKALAAAPESDLAPQLQLMIKRFTPKVEADKKPATEATGDQPAPPKKTAESTAPAVK